MQNELRVISERVSLFFFFFSSRRRHTIFDCDWSSDVCSSDLVMRDGTDAEIIVQARAQLTAQRIGIGAVAHHDMRGQRRSEERRVGKECRSRWSPYH